MKCLASVRALCVLVPLSSGVDRPESSLTSGEPPPGQGSADVVDTLCSGGRELEVTIRTAIALLPELPAYVSLIDVETQESARIREALRPLEAFTVPDKGGVYINVEGATLRRAVSTRDRRICRLDVHVLAAIVWHEMAHIAGADEAGAQAHEERLWEQFLREGRVNRELGLQQMEIYRSRRTGRSSPRIDVREESGRSPI